MASSQATDILSNRAPAGGRSFLELIQLSPAAPASPSAFLSQDAGLASVGSQMLIFRVSGIRNRHRMKQTAGTAIG